MMNTKRIVGGFLAGMILVGGVAHAQVANPAATTEKPAAVQQLLSLTHLEPLIQVVATEGARHGLSLEGALFPGKGGNAWAGVVSRIQAPDRFAPMIGDALMDVMQTSDLIEAHDFFSTDLGQKVVAREVEARRRMLDAEIEQNAKRAAAVMSEIETDRAALIDQMIDTLDLVTANVSGGLNANYAFYRGLRDGGAMARRMAESEMLAMVWEQESDIRAATEIWLRAYMNMAYSPLSVEELETYVAFSGTRAGRRYNAAMFAGFGQAFEATSYDLGLAAARFMVQEDI